MYKIHSVKINNFWHRFNASGEFNEDVNIIIGRNGTGKTTFMNILHSVLAVDLDGIRANDFDSVAITLIKDGKKKTVTIEKKDKDDLPFLMAVYNISGEELEVRIFPTEDQRLGNHYRRMAMEASEEVREALSKLVALSSLSVYRLRSGQDYEVRDRHGRKAVSPVDFRLGELLQGLTHFQLDLAERANLIATKLQRDVLTSILYSKDESTQKGIPREFDKNLERKNLVSAYGQLNVIDSSVRKQINIHVDEIDNTVKKFTAYLNSDKSTLKDAVLDINFRSLEALQQTRNIIRMSLDAENETSIIFSQIGLFTDILSEFIIDKEFSFSHGNLQIRAHDEDIHYDGLSSGEKQLLIIFIETLLQKQNRYIFLTDEPELSLHIAWQREIIPAIKRLNPNAQVIAATHSPEVASKYRNFIIDMEDLIDD
jgi:predicted ATP-dependent endonuclease of OLD family